MKKVLILVLVLVMITSILPAAALAAPTDNELVYRQEVLHRMAECARELGWQEDCEVIKIASKEWWAVQEQRAIIREEENRRLQIEEQWSIKASKYPAATKIWRYLTETLLYNNAVAAGIMGNIMVEVGGGTLSINPTLYSYGSGYYYGICQWNKGAYPAVRGQDLDYQLQYLADTIEYELNTYGYMYSKGHNYNSFIGLQNASDAALAFAKAYERCGSSTYSLRQRCAQTAYDYFTGLC